MLGKTARLLALGLCLLPYGALGSDSFRDAFSTYLEVRRLEHELTFLDYNGKLEPGALAAERSKLQAAITEKRIEFQAVLKADQTEFSPWEAAVLRRLDSPRKPATLPSHDKEAVDFLSARYSDPRKLSALEWLAIREWFGDKNQEAFLRIAFEFQQAEIAPQQSKGPQLVLVQAPFQKFAATAAYTANRRWLNATEHTLKAIAKADAVPLELSAFSRIEDQAEELYRNLREKVPGEFVLVSVGEASAIVYKALDLHPELRQSPKLLGWVNMNGRLFGLAPAPEAGKKKANAIASFERETVAELYRLHQETLTPNAPLGEGFPIVNLLSFDDGARPAMNLRESLVPEGRSYHLENGEEAASLQSAASDLARKPASARPWTEAPRLNGPSI